MFDDFLILDVFYRGFVSGIMRVLGLEHGGEGLGVPVDTEIGGVGGHGGEKRMEGSVDSSEQDGQF